MAAWFEENYGGNCTRWDNMSDEQLAQWMEEIEYRYDEIPCGEYGSEE